MIGLGMRLTYLLGKNISPQLGKYGIDMRIADRVLME